MRYRFIWSCVNGPSLTWVEQKRSKDTVIGTDPVRPYNAIKRRNYCNTRGMELLVVAKEILSVFEREEEGEERRRGEKRGEEGRSLWRIDCVALWNWNVSVWFLSILETSIELRSCCGDFGACMQDPHPWSSWGQHMAEVQQLLNNLRLLHRLTMWTRWEEAILWNGVLRLYKFGWRRH